MGGFPVFGGVVHRVMMEGDAALRTLILEGESVEGRGVLDRFELLALFVFEGRGRFFVELERVDQRRFGGALPRDQTRCVEAKEKCDQGAYRFRAHV